LEFQTPQIGFAGQRFVIRRPALSETVTGGSVLDPNAVAFKRNKALHASVLRAATKGEVQAIAEALSERDGGRLDLSALSLLSRTPIDDCEDALEPDFKLVEDSIALSKAHIGALQTRLMETIANHHRTRPFRPQAPLPRTLPEFKRTPNDLLEYAVNALVEENIAEIRLDGIAMVTLDPNANLSDPQRAVYETALEHLRQSGLKADLSFTAGVTQDEQVDLLELMLWNQHAVRLYNHALKQTLVLHSDAIIQAETALRDAFPAEQSFKTGEAREALATNRKTIVPLLELFDTRGITVRDGNLRVLKTHQDREGACDPQDAA
jgi:selenocysteine-specific elongation factor